MHAFGLILAIATAVFTAEAAAATQSPAHDPCQVYECESAAAPTPPEAHRGSGRRVAWTEHVHLPQPIAYSQNPTIPGSGTPQRSQGSGTR